MAVTVLGLENFKKGFGERGGGGGGGGGRYKTEFH